MDTSFRDHSDWGDYGILAEGEDSDWPRARLQSLTSASAADLPVLDPEADPCEEPAAPPSAEVPVAWGQAQLSRTIRRSAATVVSAIILLAF